MPVPLPTDVWILIVEKYILEEDDLSSLSLADRYTRRLTLPALYHDLGFSFAYSTHRRDEIDGLTSWLTATHERAEHLRESPHLLRYVRTFRLGQWSRLLDCIGRARMISPSDDGSGSLFASDQNYWENLELRWLSVYQTVMSLVSHSPGIRRISIDRCPAMSNLLHSFQCAPLLESLNLQNCRATDEVDELAVLPNMQAFEFETTSFPPRYLANLLKSFISSLFSLVLPSTCVSPVLAGAANGYLALRTLTIRDVGGLGAYDSAICHLLASCPELRVFTFQGGRLDLEDLPNDAVPNLECIAAVPAIVRALSPGRPVNSIHFVNHYAASITASDLDQSPPSAVPIRMVTIEIPDGAMHDIIIRLGHVFKHVTHITLRLHMWDPSTEDLKVWVHAIVCTLGQWPHLRACHATCRSISKNMIDQGVMEMDARCPVAERGDPNDRGHPSLQELRLFSHFVWVWLPGKGWACRKFIP